jgi:hypothetical protein
MLVFNGVWRKGELIPWSLADIGGAFLGVSGVIECAPLVVSLDGLSETTVWTEAMLHVCEADWAVNFPVGGSK